MTTNRYTAGPNLPEDVTLESTFDGRQWIAGYPILTGGTYVLYRAFLAAGWIVEEEAPPTFDEVLRRVAARIDGRGWELITEKERAVWDAGIAEARKRCER